MNKISVVQNNLINKIKSEIVSELNIISLILNYLPTYFSIERLINKEQD